MKRSISPASPTIVNCFIKPSAFDYAMFSLDCAIHPAIYAMSLRSYDKKLIINIYII